MGFKDKAMTLSCESLEMDQGSYAICFSNLLNNRLQEIEFQKRNLD